MSNAEIAKEIVVALIGNQHTAMYCDEVTAESVAKAYEIIFNKVNELNKNKI